MVSAPHLAYRILPAAIPVALVLLGIFFAVAAAQRRRRNAIVREILGSAGPAHAAPHSRYAYALEQQQHELPVHRQMQPIHFRGARLAPRGE